MYIYLCIGNIFLILPFLKTMNSSLNNTTPIAVVNETSANTNKRKRSSLTIEQKATMYERWEQNKTSFRLLGNEFNCAKSTA
jgi:precorrin-4 methylase